MRYYSVPSGDNISNETGSNSFTAANKFEHSLKGTAQPKMKIMQLTYSHIELCYVARAKTTN